MSRPKYSRFSALEAEGLINNRMTLQRRIDAGTFPPPVDLGPNTVAWLDTDLEEVDRRVKDGTTKPNPEWLARAERRKARRATSAAA
jgi:hypothetical protein